MPLSRFRIPCFTSPSTSDSASSGASKRCKTSRRDQDPAANDHHHYHPNPSAGSSASSPPTLFNRALSSESQTSTANGDDDENDDEDFYSSPRHTPTLRGPSPLPFPRARVLTPEPEWNGAASTSAGAAPSYFQHGSPNGDGGGAAAVAEKGVAAAKSSFAANCPFNGYCSYLSSGVGSSEAVGVALNSTTGPGVSADKALALAAARPDQDGVVRIAYEMQQQSLFFSLLPKEIRLLIYERVLGGWSVGEGGDGVGRSGASPNVLHVDVVYSEGRLAHARCCVDLARAERGINVLRKGRLRRERGGDESETTGVAGGWGCEGDGNGDKRSLPLWQHRCLGWAVFSKRMQGLGLSESDSLGEGLEKGWGRIMEKEGGLVSVLRSCRRVYSEAISILYTHNLFHLTSTTTLDFFHMTILPHRFQQIRHLCLSAHFLVSPHHQAIPIPTAPNNTTISGSENLKKWPDTCTKLASMSGLRSLQIEMTVWDEIPSETFQPDEATLMKLLGPMREVKQVVDFRLLVTCKVPHAVLKRLGDVPFVVLDQGCDYSKTDTSVF